MGSLSSTNVGAYQNQYRPHTVYGHFEALLQSIMLVSTNSIVTLFATEDITDVSILLMHCNALCLKSSNDFAALHHFEYSSGKLFNHTITSMHLLETYRTVTLVLLISAFSADPSSIASSSSSPSSPSPSSEGRLSVLYSKIYICSI